MHLSRLTDALRRARAAKDSKTRDVWVREAWLAFWRVDAWRWYGATWRFDAALRRCQQTQQLGDSKAMADALWRMLQLLPPTRAALGVLKLWGRYGW